MALFIGWLVLVCLDFSLGHLILLSIRRNDFSSLTTLFLFFYIQAALTIVPVHRLLSRKERPKHFWLGRFCLCGLLGLLVLTGIFLIRGGAPADLLLPEISRSQDWVSRAILALRIPFCICGFLLMVRRPSTRKIYLISAGLFFLAAFMSLGLVKDLPLFRDHPEIRNLHANLMLFLPFHLAGIIGALEFPFLDPRLRKKDAEKRPAAQAPAGSGRNVPSGFARSASLKKVSEELAAQKQVYEQRMKKLQKKVRSGSGKSGVRGGPEKKTGSPVSPPAPPIPSPAPPAAPKKAEAAPASLSRSAEEPVSSREGTGLDEASLLRFIQRILLSSEKPRQSVLSLTQLKKIMEEQNCPPGLIRLIEQTIQGLLDDPEVIRETAVGKGVSSRSLEDAVQRAHESRIRREMAERQGRC